MGEEETELEGGVYGGENFLNNVRKLRFMSINTARFLLAVSLSIAFSCLWWNLTHILNFQASLTLPPFSHPATNLGRVLVDDQVEFLSLYDFLTLCIC